MGKGHVHRFEDFIYRRTLHDERGLPVQCRVWVRRCACRTEITKKAEAL